MNLYNDKAGTITIIIAIIIVMISMLLFFVIGMGSQERKYINDVSCEKLKECILLDVRCLNERVNNKILMFEWGFEQKVMLSKQKRYYVNSCINN